MISEEKFGVRHRDAAIRGADASAPLGSRTAIESGDTSPQSKWKPYPNYKDSGVEWLGEVPEGWEVTNMKWVASIKYGLGEPPQLLADGLPFIRATNVSKGQIVDHEMQFVDPMDVPWKRDPILRVDDIIVVRSGAYTGDSAIIPKKYDGAIAGYDMVVRSKSCDAHFLGWAILSRYILEGQIELESTRAAQPHLNAEELGSVILLLPSLPEQRAIDAFLDCETAKIDALVEKKERLIELLQEKRTALITRAVTKGLYGVRPTVSAHVKYKDSGVEWLGEVPEGWEVKRIKYLVTEPLKYGANEAAELNDSELPRYIRITDIKDDGNLREETFRSLPEETATPYLLSEGDILFARSGATVGKTFRYEHTWGRAAYAGYLIRARLDDRHSKSRFIHFFTMSKYYWDWLFSNLIQATIQNVSAERYANLFVPVPQLREQTAIINFLDRETAKIDALSDKVREAIERLKEYRTALISAAVTGKIDVRES